jgi:hypothetical protein
MSEWFCHRRNHYFSVMKQNSMYFDYFILATRLVVILHIFPLLLLLCSSVYFVPVVCVESLSIFVIFPNEYCKLDKFQKTAFI